MTTTRIINAAPMVLARGIQDLSTRSPVVESPGVPTHLPKIYLYTQWGPVTPQHVNGAHRTSVYGTDSFDLRKGYANHQTVLSNVVEAGGGSQMIERVLPIDHGPRSNFLLSLDIVADDIAQYQRTSDGSYVLNVNTGLPVPLTAAGQGGTQVPVTKRGFKAKWSVTSFDAMEDEPFFGQRLSTQGDLVATGTVHAQSTRFPIMEFQASCYGGWGNNAAVRLWAPTEKSSDAVNSDLLSSVHAYPFRMAVMRRATSMDTPVAVATQGGDQYLEFVLKAGALDKRTDMLVSLTDQFPDAYRDLQGSVAPKNFGDFGALHLYTDNIEFILNMVQPVEAAVTTAHAADWTVGATDNPYLFNLVSGVSSHGEPYYTFALDTASPSSVRLSETTNLYAGGGGDGTMSNGAFATLVGQAVGAYANVSHAYMDDAVYPESILYDTGFPLDTKRELCKFISQRKDTAVVLSTYTVDGGELTQSQEHSIAVTLKSYLQLYAESDYFGTQTLRGAVVGRYGELANSPWKGKLPLTIQWAQIFTKMMGAADGMWKSQYLADAWPNTQVTMFKTINVTNMPAPARNSDWSVGVNWVQAFDEVNFFFPAMRGVCDDDTSIFTSFITTLCAVELQKVGQRVWRYFTGSVRLTDDQLVDRVNRKVEELTVNRFCNIFQIVPEATITSADAQAGYRWTLPITLYANNMKTVMTLDVRGRRMSDLTTP
jgi:hypothetical protein